jgi:coenzyme PQQ synthesis protein D (PqqD)
MPAARFTVSPRVINETIDGEAVMINLTSGNYYILDPTGAEIWGHIERSASLEDIVAALEARYEAPAGAIANAVSGLIEELEREDLIVSGSKAGTEAPAAPADTSVPRTDFQNPRLDKFTDMQDLILIDPVHQVDEAGWPHAKPADRH